jgi:uncharacterized protein (TIGR03066 family)
LGYHYLTLGHSEAALTEFRKAKELQPKDEVSASLVRTLSPRDTESQAPAATAPDPVPAVDVVGVWEAAGKESAKYSMKLAKDGTLVWSFSRGTRKDEVKGVYTVEGNILAMEPETGGVMLAELTMKSPGQMLFHIVGSDKKDPGLEFQKSN